MSRFLVCLLAVLLALVVLSDATGFPQKGGACCCCGGGPAPAAPPSSCCGRRKKRQGQGLLQTLLEYDNRLYCCAMSGRKRRAIGAPITKRLDFWAINHLGAKLF